MVPVSIDASIIKFLLEFALKFLEEEHVAVIPGNAFGDSGEGFIRISYAYSIEKLKIAMERLKRFVEKLRTEKINCLL